MLEFNYMLLSVLFSIVQIATIIYFIRMIRRNKKYYIKQGIYNVELHLKKDFSLYKYIITKHFSNLGLNVRMYPTIPVTVVEGYCVQIEINERVRDKLTTIVYEYIHENDLFNREIKFLPRSYYMSEPLNLKYNPVIYFDDEREYKKAILKGLI